MLFLESPERTAHRLKVRSRLSDSFDPETTSENPERVPLSVVLEMIETELNEGRRDGHDIVISGPEQAQVRRDLYPDAEPDGWSLRLILRNLPLDIDSALDAGRSGQIGPGD
jgi:hypothetical protein